MRCGALIPLANRQRVWSLPLIYYHTSVSAGGNVAFARQVSRGNITVNFSGNINANLDADVSGTAR